MAYNIDPNSSSSDEVIIDPDPEREPDPDTNTIDLLMQDIISGNARISEILKHCAYSSDDIDRVQVTANQLVNHTLDRAIRVCMLVGYDKPLPSALLLFDTKHTADHETYAELSFERAVAHKAEQMLSKFVHQWVHIRRRLLWSMRLFRHWTCTDETPPSAGDEPVVKHTFVFEAKFSLPQIQQPTPQCTANVYFFFDVVEFDCGTVTENVCVPFAYQFEGMVFKYKPYLYGYSFDFQEGILLQILAHKKRLFASLDF